MGISRGMVRKTIAFVLRQLGLEQASVSVSFVGERRMQGLNRAHRGIDQPTDVLSFSLAEGKWFPAERDLGDVFLCPVYIRRQARRFAVSYQEECTRLLIHGILHLAGHDHRTKREAGKMFELQEKWRRHLHTKMKLEIRN